LVESHPSKDVVTVVSRRVLYWYLAGFTASLVTGLAWSPQAAHAQSTLTNTTPLPSRRSEPQRRVPAPQPTDEDESAAPPPIAVVRPPEEADTEQGSDQQQDGDDPKRADQRRNRDGEPVIGIERPQQEDGQLPVGEPAVAKDGEPDSDRDPRLKSDIDAFEKPAAGYDELAFQIDDINPLLDRRPARLARFEPYDPLGIKRGTWIIFPEIEFGVGATSNIRRSPASDPN
jgi:hypothetical protein